MCMRQSPEETRHKLSRALSNGITQDPLKFLQQLVVTLPCEMSSTGRSLEIQCPIFIETGHIGTLSSANQNPRLPEGKYVFHVNHICTIKAQWATLLTEWWIPSQKSKFPDTSQGPILHAGLPKDSYLRLAVFSFLYTIIKWTSDPHPL